MQNHFAVLVKSSVVALGIALVAGCAAHGDTDKVRASINEANQKAEQALQTANEAKTMAARAEQRADEGVSCCNDVKQGMDRMFKRSMRK